MILTGVKAEESSDKVRELSSEIDDALRQLLEEEQRRIESPKGEEEGLSSRLIR